MKVKGILNKCLGLSLLFVSCSVPAYSMGWVFGKAPEPVKKRWVKKASVQAEQTATANVLDQLLQDNNYPEVAQLFSTFMKQRDDESQYALRWAQDAANRGVFPVQYELLKYYQNRFNENIAGLSTQEVEYLCELIIKGELLVRMAYRWFCYKGDSAMTTKGFNLWRSVTVHYNQFLTALLEKYEPDYKVIYNNVNNWLEEQHEVLRIISPLWMTTGIIQNDQLIFGLPEVAIQSSLYGSHKIDGLYAQNKAFLTTPDKVNHSGHLDHESWKNFCAYLKNIAEPKKSN